MFSICYTNHYVGNTTVSDIHVGHIEKRKWSKENNTSFCFVAKSKDFLEVFGDRSMNEEEFVLIKSKALKNNDQTKDAPYFVLKTSYLPRKLLTYSLTCNHPSQ